MHAYLSTNLNHREFLCNKGEMQILKNNSSIERNMKSFSSDGVTIKNVFPKTKIFEVSFILPKNTKSCSHITLFPNFTYIRCSNGFCKIHKATDFLRVVWNCWIYPQSFPKPSYSQEITFLEGKHKLIFFLTVKRLNRAFEMKSWLTVYIKKRISCFFAHSSAYSPWRKLLNTAGMC